MKKRYCTESGFTLAELLLYTGVASLMVVAISSTITLLWEARIKNRTIAEVEQQGMQVMEFVTQTIRNAESVTAPAAGSVGSTMTLDVVDTAVDPTVFRLSSGQVVVDEGSTTITTALTNDHVAVSDLTFTNLSGTSTPGIIRVQFTMTYSSASSGNEYTYAQTFTGSAVLR